MRRGLKIIFNGLALLAVSPLILLCRVTMALFGPQQGFAFWSQALAVIPDIPGVALRRAFYRATLKQCGSDVCITFGTILSHAHARIGDRTYIGAYCTLGRITVDADALIASHVSVMNGLHQHGIERDDLPIREQPGLDPDVTLGAGCWIGERAIIAADVGPGAIVAAAAVVTRPVAARTIVRGMPARLVRLRSTTSAVRTDADINSDLETAAGFLASAGPLP